MASTSILAGKFKGRKIKIGNQPHIRPTQSKVRKGIFDMLPDLKSKTVLDLYAGAGTLGFEALSRGATSVTFVDCNFESIRILKENRHLFHDKNITIIHGDVFDYLKKKRPSYHLIFADPPYGQVDLSHLYHSAFSMLVKGGILMIESSIRERWNRDNAVLKKYGETQISLFYKES